MCLSKDNEGFLKLVKNLDLLGWGEKKEREIDRQKWISEVFPEWGDFLNCEIENAKVKPGTFILWWFGACSWFLKTYGGANVLIDNYSGPSIGAAWEPNTKIGVLRQTGALKQVWLRLNPHVIDPFAFKSIDALLTTHNHVDHCDIYTIKALLKTTKCLFIGPQKCCMKFESFGVPKERIIETNVGDSFKIKDLNIKALESSDNTVLSEVDYRQEEMNKAAVNYLLKTKVGTIYHAGDSHYSNMFFKHGKQNKIDLALVAFGDNPDGMTDKMTSYDAYRVAKALKTKVLIPMHYDNWAIVQGDPLELERIVQEKAPWMKMVIMQWGGNFEFPTDIDIKRYKYPKQEDQFRPEFSWEYGDRKR